jgi:hypothetical protein
MRVLTAPLGFPIRATFALLYLLPLFFKFVMLGPARAPHYLTLPNDLELHLT